MSVARLRLAATLSACQSDLAQQSKNDAGQIPGTFRDMGVGISEWFAEGPPGATL